MKKNILIIGGTGLIGKRIAEALQKEPVTVWIGSRNPAPHVGNNLKIDTTKPETLYQLQQHKIDLVVLCASDIDNAVLRYCIDQSIDYLDITKPTSELRDAYQWAKVQNVNSQIVFSSGWMGGIVGSMAHFLLPKLNRLELYIYYSLKDLAGPSTTQFIAKNVSKPFFTYREGKSILTKHFLNPKKHFFEFGIGNQTTYDFDIPEHFIFYTGEAVPTVHTLMTYDVSLVSTVLHFAQKISLFNVLPFRLRQILFNASGKGDRLLFEVVVSDDSGQTRKMSLMDHEGQAHLTAFSALLHIQKMSQQSTPGVFFSHQIHDPSVVVQSLAKLAEVQLNWH